MLTFVPCRVYSAHLVRLSEGLTPAHRRPLASLTTPARGLCLLFFSYSSYWQFPPMKSPTVLSECDKDALRTWAGHRCEYTTGILEQGCGREADKARGVAECLRDHIRLD